MTRAELSAALRADADEWERKSVGAGRWLNETEVAKITGLIGRLRAAADLLAESLTT